MARHSKHRLQATVKSLNRNQVAPLIRFHGNGNGLQVYWEVVGLEGAAPTGAIGPTPTHAIGPRVTYSGR